jgi:hypothetical protein
LFASREQLRFNKHLKPLWTSLSSIIPLELWTRRPEQLRLTWLARARSDLPPGYPEIESESVSIFPTVDVEALPEIALDGAHADAEPAVVIPLLCHLDGRMDPVHFEWMLKVPLYVEPEATSDDGTSESGTHAESADEEALPAGEPTLPDEEESTGAATAPAAAAAAPWPKRCGEGAEEDPAGLGGESARQEGGPDAAAESEGESDAASGLDEVDMESDASDAFHVEALSPSLMTWQTDEDRRQESANQLAARLRDEPLQPPDPQNAARSWTDVNSGVKYPAIHCAFKDCGAQWP